MYLISKCKGNSERITCGLGEQRDLKPFCRPDALSRWVDNSGVHYWSERLSQ